MGLDLPGCWPLPNLAPPSPQPAPSQQGLPFQCPMGCTRGWLTLKSCVSHIECVHLPSLPDTSPLLPWLQRMNRRVCARCLLLAPISGRCRRCDALPLVDLGVLPQGPAAQPDTTLPLTGRLAPRVGQPRAGSPQGPGWELGPLLCSPRLRVGVYLRGFRGGGPLARSRVLSHCACTPGSWQQASLPPSGGTSEPANWALASRTIRLAYFRLCPDPRQVLGKNCPPARHPRGQPVA